MNSIGLEDVSVRFGEVEALSNVSVDLSSGGVTMLAGPNGSGKSTLMGVLLGLVRPDSGGIVSDGVRKGSGKWLKEQLGYLPESVAFAPNLSGQQVLRFFASARGVPASKIDAVLKKVQLEEAASRPVRGYSRGMIQRLGLAVATLSEPDLLVLDEPTGGLDQAGISVLWTIIEEQRKRGGTILMASHDLVLMEKRVDQVVMLDHGKLRAKGSPDELREQAKLPLRVQFEQGASHANTGDGANIDASVDTDSATDTQSRAREFLLAIEGLEGCVLKQSGQKLVVEVVPDHLLPLLALQAEFRDVVTGIRIEEPGFDAVYESVLKVGS